MLWASSQPTAAAYSPPLEWHSQAQSCHHMTHTALTGWVSEGSTRDLACKSGKCTVNIIPCFGCFKKCQTEGLWATQLTSLYLFIPEKYDAQWGTSNNNPRHWHATQDSPTWFTFNPQLAFIIVLLRWSHIKKHRGKSTATTKKLLCCSNTNWTNRKISKAPSYLSLITAKVRLLWDTI